MHSLSCFDAQVSKECAWLKISTQIATSDTDTDLSTFSWLSVQEVNSVSASCHFVASATQEKCIIACFLIVRNRIQAGNLLNKQQCSRQSELIQHHVSLTRTWERHSTACHRMACAFILERTAWLLGKKCSRRLAKKAALTTTGNGRGNSAPPKSWKSEKGTLNRFWNAGEMEYVVK